LFHNGSLDEGDEEGLEIADDAPDCDGQDVEHVQTQVHANSHDHRSPHQDCPPFDREKGSVAIPVGDDCGQRCNDNRPENIEFKGVYSLVDLSILLDGIADGEQTN